MPASRPIRSTSFPDALITAAIAFGVLGADCSRTTWTAAYTMHTAVRATEMSKPT